MPLDNTGGDPLPSEEEQRMILAAWGLLREACRDDRCLLLLTLGAFLEKTIGGIPNPGGVLRVFFTKLAARLDIDADC